MVRVVVLSVALLLAALLPAPEGVGATGETARLTVRFRFCPRAFTHDELFVVCHNHPTEIGTFYQVVNHVTRVSFEGQADAVGDRIYELPPGSYQLEGPPGDFIDDRGLFCSPTDDPSQVTEVPVLPELRIGDDITCEFLAVPSDPSNHDPATALTPDPGGNRPAAFYALVCDGDPGRVAATGAPFPPSGCRGQTGVRLIVTTGDARLIGGCTTGPSGFCHVTGPFASPVIVREDLGRVPRAYAPQANPLLVQASGGNVSGFVNIPVGALPSPVPAPGGASLTVHARVCPAGYAGDDRYGACNPTPPDYPQTIFVTGDRGGADARSAIVDRDGNATFAGLPSGRRVVQPGLPSDAEGAWVFCARVAELGTRETLGSGVGATTSIDLAPGDDIVCDVYTLPFAG